MQTAALISIVFFISLFISPALAIDAPILALAEDTGVNDDGITSNGTMLVSGLETGAAWEYSVNQGTSWTAGSGASFVLDDATYPAGYIQIRQTNAGVTSSIISNTGEIVVAGNLIDNGDFQQGNVKFITDYIYFVKTGPGDCDEGYYSIIHNAHDAHDGNGNYDSGFVNAPDHTYGTYTDGLYFVANASGDTSDVVWQSTSPITVEAGVAYRFEAYLMNLTNDLNVSANYPYIHFQIGDGSSWTDLDTTDVDWTPNEEGLWHVTYADGTFSTGGTFYIRMLNNQSTGWNDLGLDDIYFGLRGGAPSASDPTTNPTSSISTFNTSGLLSIALAQDTGASSSDTITSNGQVNVSGLAVSAIWRYSADNGSNWYLGSGTSFTLTGDGSKFAIVSQSTDGGGTWSTSTAPLHFTLDTAAPALSSGAVGTSEITFTFSEALNGNNPPSPSDFSVLLDGTTTDPALSLNVSGSTITLTLQNSLADASTILINYLKSGSNVSIADIAGNALSAFTLSIYAVDYDANTATGGSVPETQYKNAGSTVTISGNTGLLEKTGYSFDGWNTASGGDGTNYAAGSSYTADAALTLYVKWAASSYTVSFDAQSGSVSPASQSATYGSPYGTLPTPTRAGHTFDGWYTGTNGSGSLITGTTTVSTASNHTLYAKWTINQYTVSFNPNGGSAVSDVARNYGAELGTLPQSARTGFLFDGWYYDADLKNATKTTDTVSSSITLYAAWDPVLYTVSYDPNGATGGTKPPDGSYYYNDSVTASANTGALILAGFSFTGWNTEADGSGDTYVQGSKFLMPDHNVTLYAKWDLAGYPQTGDTSNQELWISLCAIAFTAFILLRLRQKNLVRSDS